MSTTLDQFDNNMAFAQPIDDYWTMPPGVTQTPLLNFGTNDLASYAFVPPNIDLESSAPDDTPLDFGTGALDSYQFSPFGIDLYEPASEGTEEALDLLLHGAIMTNTMPYATGDADTYNDLATGYDGMLPHDGSTLTAIACEGLSAASGTADTQPGVWNDNDMPVAGPSSASQSTTTFEWFELADTSTVTSPSDREQSLEAPPLAGPSRLSQSLPHIHSAWPIDNQYGTAWPSFDASSGRSAGCGSQSDGSMGRTFPSSETIDHRMGEGVWANERLSLPGRHYDDADASSAELGNQFGLDVQSDNTMITPEQSQGSLPRFAQPAGSSRAAPSGMMQKAKAQMTTKARSKKAKKAQADPNMEMPAALLLPIPFPRVLFKDTERGRQCAAKGLTKDSTAPFTCFICEEYCKPTGQNGEYEAFATWKQFQSHISRCAPRESMLPRCPFCDHPEPAYGRPHQMERHLVGYGGNAACKALAKLVASGTKTNRALADWLEEHGKPIIPKFLGMRLARIFHYAKYQDLEMHDEPDLTPQHREDEAA